ncbi:MULTISPECIES: PD-(D/E)XK nuclease family protein [unclassified Streptomyces]|uniref:PD-(D/E)XK nuclease family protein n=1 Tax=unclassified Streptomyces TaxID=2593676 RepID=UPI0029AC81DB|nr:MULTISPECIES: PD-(D/E)XK nuclease family protein [unclassified Streptomyces]MDX3766423.1 PD-(D/E)XK nuclease family protein [Streptomyces sp. AK08-01B]MDX3816320.1 PD-(D/E)XK nuclease family protein [Streptomyces sp. AK08-01A]
MSAQPMESAVSLWTAAHDVDARRPRSLQRQLGASDTVCERRAAYVLFGVTASDWSEKRAAILGTYIHEGLLGAARTEYGWLVERAVADDTIRGHIDAVQLDEATAARVPARHRPKVAAEHGVTVEDVKTKSTYLWEKVRRYGPSAAELRQVYLYADLLRTTGFEDVRGQRYLAKLGPLEVARIRFRFVNRDNGEEHIEEFDFDPNEATRARWWVQRVRELKSPEEGRRDFDGPGLDAICDHCPFMTACWGPPESPGAAVQTVLIHDDVDRAQALAEYVQGHELALQGNRMKALARKKVDLSPAGVYGANELAWLGGNDVWSGDLQAMVDLHESAGLTVPMVPDEKRMVANLKEAGLAVPEKKTAQKTPKTINVRAYKA